MSGFGLYNYWMVILLMMTGFYIVIARPNLIKKIIGLRLVLSTDLGRVYAHPVFTHEAPAEAEEWRRRYSI